MLEIGHRAPEFTLPADDGSEISLTTLLNRGPLLLCFLPAPLATSAGRATRGIAALQPQVQLAGLQVACISQRPLARYRRAPHCQPLWFPLLSDAGKDVIQMYEVAGPAGIGVRQASFLIDCGRIIRGSARSAFRGSPHARLIRQARTLLPSPPPA